jgi:hypothetical protein
MRLLGVKLWMWCLEFQTRTGEGWPHWHLLIDLADLPAQKIDLGKAWKLWRDNWKLGGLQLATKQLGQQLDAVHALNYITKYLVKHPAGGYPEWVLHAETIRFVQGSRVLGPLVGRITDDEPDDALEEPDDEPEDEPDESRRSNLLAMSYCGLTTHCMVEELDGLTGEITLHFRGTLPVSPGQLEILAHRGEGIPATVERRPDTSRPGKSTLVIHCPDLNRLTYWLEAKHSQEWIWRESQFQRECILATNQFASRRAAEESRAPPN